MIDDLKPYPAMKDSGVPWLGEVPEHWEVMPLKRWVSVNNEVLAESTAPDYEFRYMDIGSVGTGTFAQELQEIRFSAAPSRARRVVREGDTVVSTVRTYLKAIYFVEQRVKDLVCSTGFAVLTPQDPAVPKFVSYLIQSESFTNRITADSVGIAYPAIAETRLGSFEVAVPPVPEQAAIVRFLDHADRRIRRYIRAKRKLIKLLEEQKQAIIHRAVTRGLDPDVRLKPSDVEWLGEVPEHWEVVRLGRVVELLTGFPFKSEGFTQDEGDVRLLRGVNVTPGKIRWTDVVRWPQSDRESYEVFELRLDDIVLGMDRPIIRGGTRVSAVEKSDIPALLVQRVAQIRPKRGICAEFLTLLLAGKAFADYLIPIFTGVSVPHLSPEQIRSFRFALPSVDEQKAILASTSAQTRNMSAAESGAEREILLLRQYRTRLIADVVTGKLDVREATARLPGELDDDAELEPDEELLDTEDADGEELAAELEEVEA